MSPAATAARWPSGLLQRAAIVTGFGWLTEIAELKTGTLEIAALATLAVDPMATLIGRFRERHPGVQVRVHEPEGVDGIRALVRDGACELGAAHLPLPGRQLAAHPLGD